MTNHLRDLKPDDRNARRHNPRNVGQIERSIQANGFGRSLLLANDGTIIAGNATYDAASAVGLENVLVVETDGTRVIAVKRTDVAPGSKQFHELAIADNRAAELADWDSGVLQLLAEQEQIDLTQFFQDDELNALLADLSTTEGLTDPDDVPAVPDEPVTKPGDLWLLGRHRLLCGDATVVTDVDRLMNGEKADCIWTDPPYGIGFRSPRPKPGREKDIIANDADPNALERLLRDWLPLAWLSLRDGGALWACCTAAGPQIVYPVVLSCIAEHFDVQDTVAWDKEDWGTGWYFRRQWEAIIFAGKGKIDTWNGGHDQPNVVRYKRLTPQQGDHPTPKPVELVSDFVGWTTNANDLVVDFFGGSGATLIACEETGRRSCLLELEPKYVDQTIARWERFTGQTATLAQRAEAA